MSQMPTQKSLSLLDATMLVMGGIIGVGIFFTPGKVAAALPETGPFLLAWALGAVAALAGAMTFAELCAAYPRTGGWYVFLREAFGRFPAFLFAWVVLFVVSTGACALVARFFGNQVAALAGDGAPPWLPTGAGAAALVGITCVALTGVKSSARFQNGCMALKLAAIGTLVVLGFTWVADGASASSVAAPAEALTKRGLAAGFLAASLPVLFAFGGWQLLSYIAPEVKDPQRTLPRAIVLGVAGVALVYFCVNLAYLRVIGIDGLATDPEFATTVAHRALGEHGGRFLTAAMTVSAFGFLVATLIATPGIYVAMAREGLFPSVFGRLNERTGAPVVALVAQCGMALGYLSLGNDSVGLLTDAVVFAEWIFHALCGLALLKLARRLGSARPFVSPLYPLFPIMYTAIAVAVVVGNLLTNDPAMTGIGICVLALGAAVYWPWTRNAARRTS
jgi:APA family basic amino acid/polyamine antiporter